MATETKTAKTKAKTTVTSKKTEPKLKSCPLNGKLCGKTKEFTSKTKKCILENYRTPKFMVIAGLALLALICLFTCNKEVTKMHFSKSLIVKEIIKGDDSTYYLCRRNFPEGKIKPDTFYVSCTTKVVEN